MFWSNLDTGAPDGTQWNGTRDCPRTDLQRPAEAGLPWNTAPATPGGTEVGESARGGCLGLGGPKPLAAVE